MSTRAYVLNGGSACFLGALQLVAGMAGKKDLAANAKIHTSVHIGEPTDVAGFGLAVDIEVEGVPDEKLIQDAHAVRISPAYLSI